VSTNTKSREAVVPEAAARRLSNQVARARRGTYGAQTGLRTLMRTVSAQMLRSGSSPEAVARAVADFVLNCPTAGVDPLTAMTAAVRATALADLTAEFASDAAGEMAGRSATIVATPRDTSLLHS
jgi:hypothetical protein